MNTSPPPLRVLLLEDNPRDAKLTASILERGGYRVQFEVTDSAEFFRERLENAGYDVILADFNLGSWNALDALEILKRSGKDVPLIVVTGSLGDEAAVECIKQGAADFVLKDRPARLPTAVQRALEETSLHTENKRAFEAISRLATIVDSSDDAIIGATLEGVITNWNNGAEKLYGYSAAEVLGQPVSVLAPLDRSEEGAQMLATLRHGTLTEHSETVRVRKDGSLVNVSLSVFPLTDSRGEVTGAASIARDITDRKRAEDELLFKTALLEAQSETTLDGILVVDLTGQILLANRQFARMLNIPEEAIRTKKDKKLIEHALTQLKDPDAFLERVNYIYAHETEKTRDEIEFKDGRVLDRYSSPMQDSTGKLYGRIWYFRDITERKRAEEALVEERHLLYTLMDNLPALIYFKDRESHFTRINKAHAKLFGLSDPAQAVGKSDFDFFTAEHAQEAYRDEQEIIRTGQPLVDREEKETWSDGRVTWASITKMPLRDANGNIIGTFGVSRDITERKRAEAEHVRLVTAIEQSAEAVVITKTTGDIEYVNPAFTRITGYSCEEVLGQNPRILKSGKQDLAFYQQLWATILKGEIWHGEVINRKKDGSLYTEAMNIAPVRNPAGEVVNFIATKQDVTKRKSMEAQLLQAAKMEAIGRLAGGVAHDFNNLLTIISGYGHLLQERLSPQDLGHVEEILKASDRAAALTRQLLAFSRRQILAPQVLDLNSLVANLEKMLRRLIGEDIELTTVQQSGLGRVKADPGQIEQVIINLAVNARDAMPQGGKLTIETANVKLDETYARSHAGITPGPHVMLAVSDTGLGMDPETLGSIFEPFFTTKEKGKGTGLGLATVYGIVKQSAGSIWVYSEPGQGTTCKIYFPCIEEPMPEAEPARVRAELAKGSETILVVEDEEGVRSLVCETLKSKGYNVLDARGPSEALTIVEHYVEPIHMLLTDVVMPQMSGKELAKRLSTVRPGAKVLYMSGYTDDAIVRHGVLEAGTFFLQKPFVPSILLRKVREVLDTKLGDQR